MRFMLTLGDLVQITICQAAGPKLDGEKFDFSPVLAAVAWAPAIGLVGAINHPVQCCGRS